MATAHDLYIALVDGLADLAVDRVREIVANYDAQLSKRVALRPVVSGG